MNHNFYNNVDLFLADNQSMDLELAGKNLDCNCEKTYPKCIVFSEKGAETFNSDIVFNPVSGENFCYNYIQTSGGTELCGGFWQAKINNEDSENFKTWYPSGWTMEFLLTPKNTCLDCIDKPLLNDMFPENKGIFFYWGIKKEDTTCTGASETIDKWVALHPELKSDHPDIDTNPFLYYNLKNICSTTNDGTTIQLPDCCKDIPLGSLAFGLDNEGIFVKYIEVSGTCEGNIYTQNVYASSKKFLRKQLVEPYTTTTSSSFYGSNNSCSLENEFIDFEAPENLFFGSGETLLLHFRFKPYEILACQPEKRNFRRGDLSVYMNGFLKGTISDFPDIVPKRSFYGNTDIEGWISLGGGTQGLLEDDFEYPVTTDFFNYEFCLNPDFDVLGVELDGKYFENTFGQKPQNIVDLLAFSFKIPNSKILIEKKSVKVLAVSEKDVHLHVRQVGERIVQGLYDCTCRTEPYIPLRHKIEPEKWLKLKTPKHLCGLLEKEFAGTFIGEIHSFCLHELPLNIQDIRCSTGFIFKK